MIKRHGGVAIVQDASEAPFASMPMSAIQKTDVDYVVPVAEIAPLLHHLAAERRATGAMTLPSRSKERRHKRSSVSTHTQAPDHDGQPSTYGCPECGGALWEADDGHLLRFRCRIGHRFSAESLLAEQDERVEAAMWTALRALEEAAALRRRMADRVQSRGLRVIAEGYSERAEEAERQADVIRQALSSALRAADVATQGAQAMAARGRARRTSRTTSASTKPDRPIRLATRKRRRSTPASD
jgi:two-component system chemotaxis response regulator CheB